MVDGIENSKRSFIGPDERTEYFIGPPSADVIRGADWQYSKIYTKCLTEGISTSSEMTDTLKRRGIIGSQFDERVEELSHMLNDLIMQLTVADDNDDKATLALQVSRARDELFQWNQRLSVPMSNTCEQISDDARLEFLTASMIEYEDGTRLWDTYDVFLQFKDQPLVLKSRYEVMLYLQGYESDFLDKTPEAVAMQEVQSDIINQVAADVEKQMAAEEAEKTKEEEVVVAAPKKRKSAAKKKTTAKKTTATKKTNKKE